MSIELLKTFVGRWTGQATTWFQPGQIGDKSPVTGEFEMILDGRFLRHSYTGEMQGSPRCGEETIAFNSVTKRFQSSWVDDFHMNYAILFSDGERTETGFSVQGRYDVAGGPSWGWKTNFALAEPDRLIITAYNISPDGESAKAVETLYARTED